MPSRNSGQNPKKTPREVAILLQEAYQATMQGTADTRIDQKTRKTIINSLNWALYLGGMPAVRTFCDYVEVNLQCELQSNLTVELRETLFGFEFFLAEKSGKKICNKDCKVMESLSFILRQQTTTSALHAA